MVKNSLTACEKSSGDFSKSDTFAKWSAFFSFGPASACAAQQQHKASAILQPCEAV